MREQGGCFCIQHCDGLDFAVRLDGFHIDYFKIRGAGGYIYMKVRGKAISSSNSNIAYISCKQL